MSVVCCLNGHFYFLLCVMFTLGTFAQDRTVKGTVLDPMGEAIIGANVMVKGTANGTITDIDGNFPCRFLMMLNFWRYLLLVMKRLPLLYLRVI